MEPCSPEEEEKVLLNSYTDGSFHNDLNIVCIKEEEAEDDENLYCEECKSFFFNKCELHGPALFIPDTSVPTVVPDRARQTLPPGLEVQQSGIPGAGLGVFNKGETVPVGAHFGPYQGEAVDKEEAVNSGYSWVIYRSGQGEEYIDATSEIHANWMRYVNCARNDDEQNLTAFQYRGGIYFRCCQSISPGQELLVWYEEKYAGEDLSITFNHIWNKKCSTNEGHNAPLRVFSCSSCPLSYTAQIFLLKHIRRCHHQENVHLPKPEEIKYETVMPTISFSTQHPYDVLNTQNPRGELQKDVYHCSDCGRSFARRSNLQRHRVIHTGEKPYHCAACGKSFTQQIHLQVHQRLHTGEKPYQCSQCGKSFTVKNHLIRHQHIHIEEKPYQCPQCGRSYAHQSYLHQHQLLHTSEKRYHCSQCGKRFTNHSGLINHQRIHTGEKPYQCSQCGKRFTVKNNLIRHQVLHAGGK
ncbi:histone-lysine N-methyltransferase PRDM9-like [Trichomycterus rosablanca]|uniref:histone-lysine N-methyltransferase PRDM9-like n=1 Tax=Trichomycterus rosablanca TaxID=2290929 RepID=UPI002F35C740